MTSLAGFQGSGYLSVYAATKAFIRILGESLWYEWKNSGVDVIACWVSEAQVWPKIICCEKFFKNNPGHIGIL